MFTKLVLCFATIFDCLQKFKDVIEKQDNYCRLRIKDIIFKVMML